MKIAPPELVFYSRTYAEVMDVIYRRKLRNCEVEDRPYCGLRFYNDCDLTAFALRFRGNVVLERNYAIIPHPQQSATDDFIVSIGLTDRIERFDALGVWFWDENEEAILGDELGLADIEQA